MKKWLFSLEKNTKISIFILLGSILLIAGCQEIKQSEPDNIIEAHVSENQQDSTAGRSKEKLIQLIHDCNDCLVDDVCAQTIDIECYSNLLPDIIKLNNPDICREMHWLVLDRGTCLEHIAIETNDPEPCADIHDFNSKTRCYRTLANKLEDSELCRNIPKDQFREYCFQELAEILEDPKVCDNLDGSSKNYCLNNLAVAILDPSLCISDYCKHKVEATLEGKPVTPFEEYNKPDVRPSCSILGEECGFIPAIGCCPDLKCSDGVEGICEFANLN